MRTTSVAVDHASQQVIEVPLAMWSCLSPLDLNRLQIELIYFERLTPTATDEVISEHRRKCEIAKGFNNVSSGILNLRW